MGRMTDLERNKANVTFIVANIMKPVGARNPVELVRKVSRRMA
jgi:hypothetical protein